MRPATRRLLRTATLLALVAAAPAIAAAPAASTGIVVVGPANVIQLKGTGIYCTVVKSTTTTVACFHLVGGPATGTRKGWAVFGNDRYAGVTPPGTNTPAKLLAEPSFASQPLVKGAATKTQLVQLGLGDLVAVAGTHMGILVQKAQGGGDAIGVVYLDRTGGPITGEITVGISNHYVTLVKITGPTSSTVIYRHAVY